MTRKTTDGSNAGESIVHTVMLATESVQPRDLAEQARNRDQSVSWLKSHQMAQRNLVAKTLLRERIRRKQAQAAEREARRALAFSEAMVVEVNHRTKNTLQTATALLSLQARASSCVEVRDALLDSRARLHSLAVVHAMLGENSTRPQTVRMKQLLKTICDALREAYGGKQSRVILQHTSDSLELPVRDAMSIALVANEAITNAYKHAFPHAAAGEIAVRLHRTADHALVLRIVDTGVGADLAAIGGSIGMMLMRTLAAHLHGVLDVAARQDIGGTEVTLTIERSMACSP
jgi:two-component sensor histidine kinase